MTVNTTSGTITYTGDGSTTAWSFSFPAIDGEFIHVFITTIATGIIIEQPPTNFAVTLNPPVDPNPTSQGGIVTFPLTGPPLGVGSQITITRVLPITQDTSLANQSIIYPPVIEQALDYLTLLDQTGSVSLDRTFRVGGSDPPPALVPPVAVRANQFAFFDSAGNLTAGGMGGGGGTDVDVPISVVMQPVVGAATLTLAQSLMGVPPVNSPVFTGDPQAPTPPISDNDTSIATTAFVQSVVAGTVGATVFTTGDLKPTHKVTADVGWIMWVDGTIGDASSGSSVRSNADTSLLFALYYNSYTDLNCPLLTSGGASTTRATQGTAAAAFAAHCRMTLPRGSSRSLSVAGHGAGLSNRTPGQFVGSETHTQTLAELAPHDHQFMGESSGGTNNPLAQFDGNANMDFSGPNGVELVVITSSGGGSPMNIMQPSAYINMMIKL